MNNYYDTKSGIQSMLGSLKDLHTLANYRQRVGYKLEERLREFVIFGRWYFDAVGNMMKATKEYIPKEHFPDMPDVMSRGEFYDLIGDQSVTWSYAPELPETRIICPECGKGWDIHNCHDAIHEGTYEVFQLDIFEGNTLGDVIEIMGKKNTAIYLFQSESGFRSDQFIDLTPRGGWDDMVENEKGWVGTKGRNPKVTEDQIIGKGDEAQFCKWTYYHLGCRRAKIERKNHKSFTDIFTSAGFNKFELKPIDNQYCNCDSCAPWFDVEADGIRFIIGWRKRVISIECPENPNVDFLSLFQKEDVTKNPNLIHAWGRDKAVEYLSAIREYLLW